MLYVYINYPNTHIYIHEDTDCNAIMKHNKINQRFIEINIQSFSSEISKFLNKEYEFASEQLSNDMWLKIDFKKNMIFERSVLDFIHHILMGNYDPFKKIKPETHCKILS